MNESLLEMHWFILTSQTQAYWLRLEFGWLSIHPCVFALRNIYIELMVFDITSLDKYSTTNGQQSIRLNHWHWPLSIVLIGWSIKIASATLFLFALSVTANESHCLFCLSNVLSHRFKLQLAVLSSVCSSPLPFSTHKYIHIRWKLYIRTHDIQIQVKNAFGHAYMEMCHYYWVQRCTQCEWWSGSIKRKKHRLFVCTVCETKETVITKRFHRLILSLKW